MAWVTQSGAGAIVFSWWGQGPMRTNWSPGVLTPPPPRASRWPGTWSRTPAAPPRRRSRTSTTSTSGTGRARPSTATPPTATGRRSTSSRASASPTGPRSTRCDPTASCSRRPPTPQGGALRRHVHLRRIAGATAPGGRRPRAFCRANGLVWAPSVGARLHRRSGGARQHDADTGRDNGAAYDRQWRNALNPATGGRPTWVSVTSFNEWHEGSVIEPASSTPPAGRLPDLQRGVRADRRRRGDRLPQPHAVLGEPVRHRRDRRIEEKPMSVRYRSSCSLGIAAAVAAGAAVAVPAAPAAASTTDHAFNSSTGALNVDYAGYLSKHDIVYNRPEHQPAPRPDRRQRPTGAMVWNAERPHHAGLRRGPVAAVRLRGRQRQPHHHAGHGRRLHAPSSSGCRSTTAR